MSDFHLWMRQQQERVEAALSSFLPSSDIAPQRLHAAMRYSVLGGGKRVRPLLALAAAEISGANPQSALLAACAVEMIHAYSLVHDDLPAMDNDVLRRGKPTCHVEYDEPTALLVGDALQSLAFELLADNPHCPDPVARSEMVLLLARASGSRGMAGGQAIDLASVGKSLELPELERMHILKTGEIIRAATLLGAMGGGLEDEQMKRIDRFSKIIGLAFQVVDDLLDAQSSTATLGKTAGKDRDNDKPTYVSLLGEKGAREMAEELHLSAMVSLSAFGEKASRLTALADFILSRNY